MGNAGLHAQTGGVQTFPVSISVSGGEVLGFYFDGGGSGSSCGYSGTGDTVGVKLFPGTDPPVGSTFNPSFTFTNASLDVSATLVADSDLTLAQPSNVTVDATSPAGATATYSTPAAGDGSLTTVTVSCLPVSGSTFAIGDTTVTCTATDTDGDSKSPGQKTLTVHVNGSAEQLSNLASAVNVVGPGTGLADKVASVQSYLSSGDTADACGTLGAFIDEVKAQSGKSISASTAATLISTAQRIEALIGCTITH